MHVSIYSLKKVLYEDEAMAINCQTEAGEITVLDHHAQLVSVLKPGQIKISDKNKKDFYFETTGGFLEIGKGNQAKIIVQES